MTPGLPSSQSVSHSAKALAVESVCMHDDSCVVETKGGGEDKHSQKEWRKKKAGFFALKFPSLKQNGHLLTGGGKKIQGKTPTPNCLRVSVTYQTLQRGLIQENVQRGRFAERPSCNSSSEDRWRTAAKKHPNWERIVQSWRKRGTIPHVTERQQICSNI